MAHNIEVSDKQVSCTIYPRPELPWQEAVGRATGAPLQKLKLGSPVPTGDGNVALRVDEGKDKLIINLGSCDVS